MQVNRVANLGRGFFSYSCCQSDEPIVILAEEAKKAPSQISYPRCK